MTAQSEYATPEEAAAALEKLGQADRIRLKFLARNRLYGQNTDWEDLLQEALTRILEGTRKWPRDVPIIAFIAGVMRSMAGEYRKQQRQMRSDAETMPLASSNPGPDSEAEAKAEIKAIEGHFGDDDDALAVVMARFEGHSPEETQAMFNLTKTRYESTLKRIRRKIDQYKKKGAEQ